MTSSKVAPELPKEKNVCFLPVQSSFTPRLNHNSVVMRAYSDKKRISLSKARVKRGPGIVGKQIKAKVVPEDPDDAFIDFATEDFINKNIRVRPISGVTNKDDRGERQSNISRGAQSDRSDTHDNYNRLAEFEIDHQRKLVKKRAADYAEEMRRKQAAEEKKAQKK